MNRYLTLVAAAVLVAACGTTPFAQGDKPPIPGTQNFSRVDATVACGGATTAAAYPALKAEGFKAVINLRQASEPGADIEQAQAAAQAAGLKYIHIPMNGQAPTPDVATQFLAAVKDPKHSPVYIHCASANRVGAVWLIKRVLVDKWDVERATAEAEKIGLKSPGLKQFALDYIKNHAG